LGKIQQERETFSHSYNKFMALSRQLLMPQDIRTNSQKCHTTKIEICKGTGHYERTHAYSQNHMNQRLSNGSNLETIFVSAMSFLTGFLGPLPLHVDLVEGKGADAIAYLEHRLKLLLAGCDTPVGGGLSLLDLTLELSIRFTGAGRWYLHAGIQNLQHHRRGREKFSGRILGSGNRKAQAPLGSPACSPQHTKAQQTERTAFPVKFQGAAGGHMHACIQNANQKMNISQLTSLN
jgi:hypothetical protein